MGESKQKNGYWFKRRGWWQQLRSEARLAVKEIKLLIIRSNDYMIVFITLDMNNVHWTLNQTQACTQPLKR